MNIGERVKLFREKTGLSQAKLAAQTNLSTDYIYKIENDRAKNVGIEKLESIAHALGISITDLLKEEAA